jgi:hypothetical protein
VDHDNSSARGNGPEEWRFCTNHVRGEKAGKLRGAATPGLMYKMEMGGGKFGENSWYPFEYDGMLLTLPHVSGVRKQSGKQDRCCNWDEDLLTIRLSH